MSAADPDASNAAKKAVHVKWAGKTIALGTFPSAEADEKCARAKALTRAWRSTMRPKPTREWVMTELERLGVRVVSGKLGRKADEDEKPEGGGMGPSFESGPVDDFVQDREPQGRASSLGLGLSGGASIGSASAPAASGQPINQHYEMLKLHHMNLLQELHETTMMMNMYQQQQLQQEQLRLQEQQRASGMSGSDQMGMMAHQRSGSMGLGSGMDSLYGNGGGLSQRGSLGLGLGLGQRGSLGLGFNPRGSLGLGTSTGSMNGSQMSRIDQMSRLGGDPQSAFAGLKRSPDDGPNMDDMKRQKLDGSQGSG